MRKASTIVINGRVHPVRERAGGLLSVAMNGVLGWVSIWGESEQVLIQRIKLALRGGQ